MLAFSSNLANGIQILSHFDRPFESAISTNTGAVVDPTVSALDPQRGKESLEHCGVNLKYSGLPVPIPNLGGGTFAPPPPPAVNVIPVNTGL